MCKLSGVSINPTMKTDIHPLEHVNKARPTSTDKNVHDQLNNKKEQIQQLIEIIYLTIREDDKTNFPLNTVYLYNHTDLKYQSVDFCFLKARLLGKLCTKLEERQADVVKNRPAGRPAAFS
ncbi:hypothetical protein T03_17430 [Trichinella britovi]|uniref:Uncharacterized protein n=1 Tax=Trichinella britovi TaxID=45882 RepID=A0A0V1CIR0_TRIBR|nr:hypothetical protein T03_17430 [Trichinella britovi]